MEKYDSICLAGGSTVPRDLPIKGRDLEGVHFAMDFLSEQNRWNENPKDREITAKNKNVVIIFFLQEEYIPWFDLNHLHFLNN